MNIAQRLERATRHFPSRAAIIFEGQAISYAGLQERVWSRGSSLETAELVTQATGAPLGTVAFKDHLRARYLA